MLTAVDTNILIDIFVGDKTFGQMSAESLQYWLQKGTVCVCEVVWVETATCFSHQQIFLDAMQEFGIDFSPMSAEASLIAAKSWRKYRQNGGKKHRIAADFLIGAHAYHQCDQLLTRDNGFYRKYFKKLTVIKPTTKIN
jgi:predicted nucleic acid-binding protein